MADETEIDRMLDEKMHQENGDTKDKDRDKEKKHKKHKHHKHHKSHKSEKKHEKTRSRSRSRSPSPALPASKRRDVKSDLHQLAQTLAQRPSSSSSTRSSRREKSPDLTPEERDLRTVLCMQLAARTRPRDLEEFFSPVGKVRDVRMITDPRTRRSKGVAYVEFRDLASVQSALALSGQKLFGNSVNIKPSNAEKNRLAAQAAAASAAQNSMLTNGLAALTGSVIPTHGPMKLYVGSLHFNITEDMLRGVFEPFGRIDNVTMMRDADTGRSRGYGFIHFAHAEDAKRAMENLNGFELAGRPMKVGLGTDRAGEMGAVTSATYGSGVSTSFPSAANLDSDDLDHRGISLGVTGRLALMAKLSEGSGLQMPKHAVDALQAAHKQAAGSQHVRVPEPPNSQQLAAVTAVGTQCFMLSNMFDPTTEASQNPNWAQEIRDDVIEECNKFGGVVHIYIDEKSKDGNVYVKCASIVSAINAVNSLHGRYFSGRLVVGNYIPLQSYHKLFPVANTTTTLLTTSDG